MVNLFFFNIVLHDGIGEYSGWRGRHEVSVSFVETNVISTITSKVRTDFLDPSFGIGRFDSDNFWIMILDKDIDLIARFGKVTEQTGILDFIEDMIFRSLNINVQQQMIAAVLFDKFQIRWRSMDESLLWIISGSGSDGMIKGEGIGHELRKRDSSGREVHEFGVSYSTVDDAFVGFKDRAAGEALCTICGVKVECLAFVRGVQCDGLGEEVQVTQGSWAHLFDVPLQLEQVGLEHRATLHSVNTVVLGPYGF